MVVPERVNNLISYEIEQGQGGEFTNLPKWLQEKVLLSKELGGVKSTAATDDGAPF
jgi:hypothetical protein